MSDEVIVNIWKSSEYDKKDPKGNDLLPVTGWFAPVIPDCGDYIVINWQERKIIAIEKKIFHQKYNKLVIDILVQLDVTND